MTNTQIRLIRESFALVQPWPDAVAASFYARLFEIDPRLRRMFPPNLTEQGQKLMRMLSGAIGLLDHPPALTTALESLGRRHSGYGVRDEHYVTVGEALLWTLEKGLGAAFTPEVRGAWESLYDIVATTMQNAAKQEAPRPQPALALA